jgi:two-component system, chemotaxis family, response regulator Rcp1
MARFSAMRILLVEDNEDDVEVTRRALVKSKVPHEFYVARDGEEALQFLFNEGKFRQAGQPDLILLDLNLPKINGFEVLQKVRATERLSTTPIIIMTMSVRDEDVSRSYRLGANTYIRKPSNLLKTVEILGQYWGIVAQLPPAA